MQYIDELKKIGISLGYLLGVLLLSTLLLVTLYYFNIIGHKTYQVLQFIIPAISFLTGGFAIGKRASQKGWLEGLKLGGVTSLLFLLFTYFGLGQGLNLQNMIYFLIILAVVTFGSMIGINYKKQD